VDVGFEPHLFIDEYLIASASNIVRTTHAPKRAFDNPILGWKAGTAQPYVTVIHDSDSKVFRMWYNKDLGPTGTIAYAESDDGVHWKTPSLGILGDDNSVLHIGREFGGSYGVSVIDDGPTATPPDRRFKLAWWGRVKPEPKPLNGICVAFSSDGLHWKPHPDNPVLSDDKGKSSDDPKRAQSAGDIIDVFHDPYRKRYTALFKTPAIPSDGYATAPRAGGYIRRLVSESVSQDFVRWEPLWRIAVPETDEGLLEFYSVGGTIARGGLLIGFVRMLHDDLPADPGGPANGIGYATLITSRDGKHWQRHKDVFFDRNPDPNAWDHAMAWIGGVIPVGDEDFIYYGGYKQGHKVNPTKERQLGLARMPRDRFVSRDSAKGTSGILKTISLRPPKTDALKIRLNATVGGEIRVRLIDATTGRVVTNRDWEECKPIAGDSSDLVVTWASNSERSIRDMPAVVQLEFKLTNAALYGFEFVAPQRAN
jgi:hypothetical protein